jgi:hypothetical protein
MDSVLSATTNSVVPQQTTKVGSMHTGDSSSTDKTTDSGDQVTISAKGRELSKSAKSDTDDTSTPVSTAASTAASTLKETSTLQDTRAKISSIQGKIQHDKISAKDDPNAKEDINKLNAQLRDLSKTESKTQASLNS